MIKGASVGGMLGGLKMARKPASMYRRLKGPAYTRRKYIGGVPNNRILAYHSGNRRAAETGGFPVVLELRADNNCQIRHTALEAARVISNSTIRKEAGAQGYASVSTPTLTTSCERTSKQPVLVLTVFLKVCDVLSERTSEPLLVFDEVSESSRSTAMQPTTSLRRMHSARQV